MIAKTVLVDAGPLVSLLSRRDSHHLQCVELARQLPAVLGTCWPVITEAAYLLRRTPRGVQALLSRIDRRALEVLPLNHEDAAAVRAILDDYSDQEFDFADACLMHLSEREGIDRVFTLDRRHFGTFRTRRGQPLSLLPEAE